MSHDCLYTYLTVIRIMVKKDQDFVDPIEHLTEEELADIQGLVNKDNENNIVKVSKMLDEIIEIVDNEDMIVIVESLVSRLESIDYVNYTNIIKTLDDLYWEETQKEYGSYGYGVNSGYYDDDPNSLRNLFGENAGKYDSELTKVWSKGKGFTYSKTPSIPDFIKLDDKSTPIDLKISMSPLATAKLFLMMKFYQHQEWGAYMKLDKALPKLEDMFKDEEIEITILDLILIPQVRSISHVEYLEQELPEFMHEWRQAKIDKFYVNSGRIHSHHTMGSWHSTTDTGEFEKSFEVEERLLSIVTSFSDKTKRIDQSKDLNDWDYFFKALDFDTVLFIPLIGDQSNTVNAKFGYTVNRSLWLNKFGIDEINKAIEWREGFQKMDIFVNTKYPTIEKILRLQDLNKIDEVDFYNIRKDIFENESMFSFVEDMVKLLSETKSESNSNLIYKTRIAEIKKITER